MHLEEILPANHPKSPKNLEGQPVPSMYFEPDEEHHFQMIISDLKSGNVRPQSFDASSIPISPEDEEPMRKALAELRAGGPDNLLPLIRKFVATIGVPMDKVGSDSLSGSVHNVPDGSLLWRSKKIPRVVTRGFFNELPNPAPKESENGEIAVMPSELTVAERQKKLSKAMQAVSRLLDKLAGIEN
jgi:hypothetical protein